MRLGIAYGDAGRYDEAIRTFRSVLALDATNGLAYQNLASMVLRQALAATSEPVRGAQAARSRGVRAQGD